MKMETSAKLYSLNYSNVKTYLFALLFVAGNIALHNCATSFLTVDRLYYQFTFLP